MPSVASASPMRASLVAVLLAGCAGTPGRSEEWYLGGSWTADYEQGDIEAWCVIAEEYGNECAIMESFPPQFGLRFTSQVRCEEARAKIVAVPHTLARECSRIP